jgi:transposase
MLTLSHHQRYFLFRGIADMRKGIDGLCGMVRDHLQCDPLSGDIFIFFNRRRTQVKLLCWDRDGYALYSKRLEQGTFEIPAIASPHIGADILHCILQGISLTSIRKRKRYEKAA